MPIFEYKCNDCGSQYDVLHKGAENPDIVICPSCESRSAVKKFSSFAASTGTSSTFAPSCESGSCGVPSYNSCAGGMCGLG
ncbi:MAG: zinc ribbon domain-containing protein [Bacteroidetes bacterium]|nr:zinc ribbon domain-containing protein [Bacteroidota bacterium]